MNAPPPPAPAHARVPTLVLLAATALGLYLCYRMAAPFASALAWALALAVLFTPLQRRLESRLKHPSIAAALSVGMIVLIVAAPATFVVQRLVVQAAKGAELIKTKVASGEWRQTLDAHPRLAQFTDTVTHRIDLPTTVQTLATRLSTTAGMIVKGSAFQLITFGLTFYLLFFFLRDRHLILRAVDTLSPLSAAELARLCGRIGDTVFATVYGTLTVAAVQGCLGGLMFWWLGLPAPLLWGVVMAILAVVPMMGAFVVWIPAVVFLAAEGSWTKAFILTLWGLLAVGLIDNLLRPILMGNRLKLHPVLTFLSVVGGILVFGPAGLILGPVALTITTELLEISSRRAPWID